MTLVYFIFVFNSILPYLTAYKNSLINADQKNYRLGTINFVYQVGLNLSKLGILYYTATTSCIWWWNPCFWRDSMWPWCGRWTRFTPM